MFKSIPRILILLALLICGAARAEDETTSTMRIVVCAPSLAEYVYEVGMFDRVVGVSRFTEFPPEAAALPAVTDFANPGLEAITALKPTVIIALQSNTAVVEYFSKQPGVKIVQIGKCETFGDAFDSIRKIAKELGADARKSRDAMFAEHKVNIERVIEKRRSEARERKQHDERETPESREKARVPKVLMVLGSDVLRPGGVTAIGQGTHISELLEMSGAQNVIPKDLGAYPMLNKEALLGYNPDLILFLAETPQDATAAAKARASWSVLPTIHAVQREDGFRYLNDSRLMIPGPRAFKALSEMRKVLDYESREEWTTTTVTTIKAAP
jgi:iron complex transport system substrate-binding protein